MFPKRMTVEELNELNPTVDNPVELECDDGHFIGSLRRIKVLSKPHNSKVFAEDACGGGALIISTLSLGHYPSKKQPNIETLYECLGETGYSEWRFTDGTYPKFLKKSKSNTGEINILKRKTGRTLKIDMDTFEIISEE